MTKLAPEWVRPSDPVIRSPACYRWTTAPADNFVVPNISPDYVMPADTPRHVKPYIVVFAFWISDLMAIAVESVEMGGGGVD